MKAAQKALLVTIHYSKRAFALLRVLYLLGAVTNYTFYLKENSQKLFLISPSYYRKIPLIKHFRMLSTPSRTLTVSYKALKLIQKREGEASFLIATSFGIMSHHEAIKKRIGGILLGFFFS